MMFNAQKITAVGLVRPLALVEGASYWMVESHWANCQPTVELVQLITHTACPAVVLVRDAAGKRMYCPRDSLLFPAGEVL